MRNAIRMVGIAVCLALMALQPARAAEPTPGPSVDEIAVSAYLYFYSVSPWT